MRDIRLLFRLLLATSILLGFEPPGLSAQDVTELCPNARPEAGVLIGVLSDVDAQMGLPGATVRATWVKDGIQEQAEAQTEAQTGFDGGFTVCDLPRDTELAIQGMLGNVAGEAVRLILSEPITRQDIGFSLTSLGSGKDERMWACIGPQDSSIRMELGSLVRCEVHWQPLEQCPREELGRVSASAAVSGRGALRDVVERLVEEARRLGANALINISGSRSSIDAQAVKIEVDPSGC